MLLALDTATRTASLALYDPQGGRVLGEEVWYCADNHTIELMPRVVRLMETQKISAADLTGIVVSLGPGSFTGLRTGLGVAKGLALARRLPLVGIPTLEVVAQPHTLQALPIWAVLQAGRGRLCAAHYVRRRARWHQQGPYSLTTWEKLCPDMEKPSLLCGEIDARDRDLIRDQLGPDVVIATPAAALRRAGYLAELGWERLAQGSADDPASLSPIYLQQPQIYG
jgi:tRNA threonylcarbamoyladenosine biosynthesis protein TsaB